VTWNFNAGVTAHNVTWETVGSPAGIGSTTNASVGRQFTTTGTFSYHCSLHPGMTGSVTVVP
jgi:plastocyanin